MTALFVAAGLSLILALVWMLRRAAARQGRIEAKNEQNEAQNVESYTSHRARDRLRSDRDYAERVRDDFTRTE